MLLHFVLAGLTIVLIDLLLGGDNAVVIAMAVRSLPPEQRRIGVMVGAGMAVALRIGITFFAARLLESPYVQLAGGVVILWIAIKLFAHADAAQTGSASPGFWRAIRLIVVADITMSLDNILAVAAASKGNFYLLLFGLGLSIPLVVFTSTLLSGLMDRFPAVIYLGGAILGRVGGEMIITDALVARAFEPSAAVRFTVQAICAGLVVVIGWSWSRKRQAI